MLRKKYRLFKAGLLVCCLCGCGERNETLRICFTGDVLLDRGIREQIAHTGVASLFKSTTSIFRRSDFVVVNLECPITKNSRPVHKKYIFRAEPEWTKDLKEAGITHLVMANNHSNDQGRSGITETYENIIKNGLSAIGYGHDQQQACEPVILKKGNISVGLFSSVLLPLENWPYLPDSAGVCQASVGELKINIQNFKKKTRSAHAVVVLHWGAEFQSAPSSMQVKQAKELIDAGADAIIGHHPHVIQEMRLYKGKPIFYSLGNFIFDQKKDPADKGLIAELKFLAETLTYRTIRVKIENCTPAPTPD